MLSGCGNAPTAPADHAKSQRVTCWEPYVSDSNKHDAQVMHCVPAIADRTVVQPKQNRISCHTPFDEKGRFHGQFEELLVYVKDQELPAAIPR
jgi:hypothetical protein